MTDPLPCPCGKTPTGLYVTETRSVKWAFVYGECCGDWHIEFRTNYTEGDELMKHATEAWNNAPRAKP